jgi:hypothetical protein
MRIRGTKAPATEPPLGLFLILPIIDNVAAVIDERIQTTAFNAEQALTKDTVPGQRRRDYFLARP